MDSINRSVLLTSVLTVAFSSFICDAPASTLYVSPTGNHVPPYSSWQSAATNISAAVTTAISGDLVIVTNGHYRISTPINPSADITIRSVDGPNATIIDGQGISQCFYLAGNSIVEGFTITNGYSVYRAGGILSFQTSPQVNNCIIAGNTAGSETWGGGIGGGMQGCTANNCTFIGNTAFDNGGGIYQGNANDCVFIDNVAGEETHNGPNSGGGMYQGTATRCTFTNNRALAFGGGMYEGRAEECIFVENTAYNYGGGMAMGTANNCTFHNNSSGGEYINSGGGGMYWGTANNCVFSENEAFYQSGGGMYGGTANNCVFTRNTANVSGGGLYQCTANNCTITGNEVRYSAGDGGGGMYEGIANNCIVWYNISASLSNDLFNTTAINTCSPSVIHGTNGCITSEPNLISSSHISATSACRGTGGSSYASGLDIDGEAWRNPPSIGCDEPNGSEASGPIQLYMTKIPNKVAVNWKASCTVSIIGNVSHFHMNFGDGFVISNFWGAITHSWEYSGIYDISLTAYNSSYPDGMSITQTVEVLSLEESTTYVSLNGNATYDGKSWADAKATIQGGINAQSCFGGRVLVTNGVYNISSGIYGDLDVNIQSVNGPSETFVNGGASSQCFILYGNSTVSGLTITNGSGYYGGGVYCYGPSAKLLNCIISGNNAYHSGGGMYRGTAINCAFFDNNASNEGGGIYDVYAVNCTLAENAATGTGSQGGGASKGILNNCIAWYNSADSILNNLYGTTEYYTCSPDVVHELNGNLTNQPSFIDLTSHNYRLNPGSPCINRGNNSPDLPTTDLDGKLRILGGTVDLGAYESVYDGSVFTNIVFNGSGNILQWETFPTYSSKVKWSTNLVTMPFTDLSAPLPYPLNSYTDTVHGTEDQCFYKIEMEP